LSGLNECGFLDQGGDIDVFATGNMTLVWLVRTEIVRLLLDLPPERGVDYNEAFYSAIINGQTEIRQMLKAKIALLDFSLVRLI